ncbi:Uma2 family endonuclease [Nocardia sp. NPDC101769]|uniref:Uma2 family endonuclease n=1 Tax=Nocardia sp. NPDC101769 TaxID=3364333 RepID=UPI0038302834
MWCLTGAKQTDRTENGHGCGGFNNSRPGSDDGGRLASAYRLRRHRTSYEPAELVLAVEVWSPGNKRAERDTKMAGYAAAGVPYLWIVELPTGKPAKFSAYRLVDFDDLRCAVIGECTTDDGARTRLGR